MFVNFIEPNDVSFRIPEINISIVRKYFSNLDVSKYPVLDDIGPRIFNIRNDIKCSSITCLICKNISHCIFPTVWIMQLLKRI